MSKPPLQAARLTVVEQVYHQSPNYNPIGVTVSYSALLDSTEQPYSRMLKLDEKWLPIDYGWLDPKRVRLISLVNDPERTPGNPTAEQLAEHQAKIIEWGYTPILTGPRDMHSPIPVILPLGPIRPGEAIRLQLFDLTQLRLHCQRGTTRCKITLIPQ